MAIPHFTVPFLLATVLNQPVFGVDPFEQVVRAFDSRVDMNAELLVRRHFIDTDQDWQYKFKSSTASKGQIYLEFVHPTPLQGIKIILDSKTLQQFNPKEGTIIEDKSPYLYEPSNSQRLNLLKTNYDAVYEGDSRVAGRMAYVVKLIPDAKELFVRRVWVDQSALFLLRQDVWERGREEDEETVFQALTFRELQSAEKFSFNSGRLTHLDLRPGPLLATDPVRVAGFVGFSPPSTVDLPYGLTESVRHVMPSKNDYRPLRIKCTDGIASVTVWIWRTARGGSSTIEMMGSAVRPMVTNGQVGVFVEGDYPLVARQRVAASFAKAIRTREPS